METESLGRWLLAAGALIALLGAAILFLPRIPFLGRLPGDISVQRDGFSFFFPIITCILLSIILTIALNLAIRLFR
jgi:hypothetical protein